MVLIKNIVWKKKIKQIAGLNDRFLELNNLLKKKNKQQNNQPNPFWKRK